MDLDSEEEALDLIVQLHPSIPPIPRTRWTGPIAMRGRSPRGRARGKGFGKGEPAAVASAAARMWASEMLQRLSRFERRRRDRRDLHLTNLEKLKRVRPREKGGQCIIKRTLQGLLYAKLDGDSAERIFQFLGPGCDLQLHVTNEFNFDKALQEMNRYSEARAKFSKGRCCGIWLCSGTHRARTRLRCPVTVLGPANREAHVAAAEWTIAAEYLALKSVKVYPPACLRSEQFHTLLKVCAGNLCLKDCDFHAQQLLQNFQPPRWAWLTSAQQGLRNPSHTTGQYCIKVHKAARVLVENCNFYSAISTALDLRCPKVSVSQCAFVDCGAGMDCGLNSQLQATYRTSRARPSVEVLSSRFERSGSKRSDGSQGSGGISRPALLVRKQFARAVVKDCVFQNVSDAIATNCTSQILSNKITLADTAILVNGVNGQHRKRVSKEPEDEASVFSGFDECSAEATDGDSQTADAEAEITEICQNQLDMCHFGVVASHIPQVLVSHNQVDNGTCAIFLKQLGDASSNASRVECNTVTKGRGDAVMIEKSPVHLSANHLQMPGVRGIWIDGRGGNSGVPEFTITDNQISGASSTGIEVIGKSRWWSQESAKSATSELVEVDAQELERWNDDVFGEGRSDATGTIANNSVSCSGRGLLLQDVSALVEGNVLAQNKGWALHFDLRFVGSAENAQSAVLRNTVVPPKSKKGHVVRGFARSIRISLPEPGCDAYPGIPPKVCDNLRENGEALLPMKRRRLE